MEKVWITGNERFFARRVKDWIVEIAIKNHPDGERLWDDIVQPDAKTTDPDRGQTAEHWRLLETVIDMAERHHG